MKFKVFTDMKGDKPHYEYFTISPTSLFYDKDNTLTATFKMADIDYKLEAYSVKPDDEGFVISPIERNGKRSFFSLVPTTE